MEKSGFLMLLGFAVMMTGNIILLITVIPALQATPTANAGSETACFGVLTAATGYLIMLMDVYGDRIKALPVYGQHKNPEAI
jgi:hypothetical protein